MTERHAETGNGTVFYPIFRETKYQYHQCSECGHKIHLRQSAYGGVSFYELSLGNSEEIKFCPHCGNSVVRFGSKPIYETRINYNPLDVFSEVRREYERKCQWIWNCFISDDHREAIKAILPMMKTDEWVSGTYKEAAEAALLGKRYNLKHHAIKRLIAEFGARKESTP